MNVMSKNLDKLSVTNAKVEARTRRHQTCNNLCTHFVEATLVLDRQQANKQQNIFQDDVHGAPSKTNNIRNVNQNKKLVRRSRFSLNEDPVVVYKPSNARTVFQNTVFLTKIAD